MTWTVTLSTRKPSDGCTFKRSDVSQNGILRGARNDGSCSFLRVSFPMCFPLPLCVFGFQSEAVTSSVDVRVATSIRQRSDPLESLSSSVSPRPPANQCRRSLCSANSAAPPRGAHRVLRTYNTHGNFGPEFSPPADSLMLCVPTQSIREHRQRLFPRSTYSGRRGERERLLSSKIPVTLGHRSKRANQLFG